MTVTLSQLRDRVRYELRDRTQPYHVEDAELNQEIRTAMGVVAGRIPLGEKWFASEVTVLSGKRSADFAANTEIGTIFAVRRNSDGQLLNKRTQEELDKLSWDGVTEATSTADDPTDFSLVEYDGTLTITVQAVTKADTKLDVRRTVIPSDMTGDESTAPLSPLAIIAVVSLAAMAVITKLTKNELDLLRLDRGYGNTLSGRAVTALRDEEVRLSRIDSVGRQVRFHQ